MIISFIQLILKLKLKFRTLDMNLQASLLRLLYRYQQDIFVGLQKISNQIYLFVQMAANLQVSVSLNDVKT
jgi:hypothetical protein